MALDTRDQPAPGADHEPPSRAWILRWPVEIAETLFRVVPDAGARFFADRCPTYAAGIAYRVLFSIAPLAIVLVSIFGLVLQNDSIRHDVTNAIVDELPVSVAGRQDVEKAITALASPTSAVGLVSLLLFAWAATGMMAAVRGGLEAAMEVHESRPMVRGKLVDLVLIVSSAALVLLTAGLALLGDEIRRVGGFGDPIRRGVLADVLVRGGWALLSVATVLLLYRFVPARGLRGRDSLAGAIVTALLFQLISLASKVVYDQSTRFSVIYGSLTAAFVFLYSVYLYSSALLFGAGFAAAWARPPSTEVGPPFGTRLKRALLGLVMRQDASPTPGEETKPARRAGGD